MTGIRPLASKALAYYAGFRHHAGSRRRSRTEARGHERAAQKRAARREIREQRS